MKASLFVGCADITHIFSSKGVKNNVALQTYCDPERIQQSVVFLFVFLYRQYHAATVKTPF